MSFLRLDTETPELAVRHEHDCGDDMRAHRWRATWDKRWDGNVQGVLLTAYPVVKNTECGAWIDPLAYWHGEWCISSPECHRWVRNDSGQAWAKPTQELAVESLIYRHKRWSSRILNDIAYFHKVTKALGQMFPNEAGHVASALRHLELTARTGER
jgi:hypothetical protein